MSARENILARIKAGKPEASARPVIPSYPWPGNPFANFKSKLEGFDGKIQIFNSRAEAISWLRDNLDSSLKIYSAIDDFEAELSPAKIADPHAANVIDISVAEGVLGVGETGSVWVTDKSLGLAAAALLCTDLYLLLDHNKIVPGIQDAYSEIDITGQRYGSFYTGPSATADIEAVHITGAQGEISLTVLLY